VCRAAYIGALSKHRVLLTRPFSVSINSTSDSDVTFHLAVYAGLAGANSLLSLVRAFLFAYGGIEAAVVLHARLLAAILKVMTENSVNVFLFDLFKFFVVLLYVTFIAV